MRRDQLEHAIRAACQIAGLTEVIIVGSLAILGTYTEDELPFYATRSAEVDVLPIADDNDEIVRLADEIEGVAGEFSPFAELHGFNIDGVDLQTSALPEGWRGRRIKVQNANTAAPSGEPQFIGWCLDKEDLCVAKTVRSQRKGPELRRRAHYRRSCGPACDHSPPRDRARAASGSRRTSCTLACSPHQ